ncbi:MAG: hypothetical protein KAJ93_08635 [Methanosarcinales archaeon]|nr:hypothetical protein [Methanosarcinales archaeon]
MLRTIQEIKERFEKADDFMGIQKTDLISFMDYETAKPHLKKEYVEKVDLKEEKWIPETDSKINILDYLDFAYKKAENERGLSASRSMLHFKTWIWLDNDDFYNEIIGLIDNYDSYGIPALDKISEFYGYKKE